MSLVQCLRRLIQKQDLDRSSVQAALAECLELLDNESTAFGGSVQMAGFLLLLRSKGETEEELIGILNYMFSKQLPLYPHLHKSTTPALDVVGTGGDGGKTINISMPSAIIIAACGVKVIKHGAGGVSSLSGSADVLHAMGVHYNSFTIQDTRECVDSIGITFCPASLFNPVFKSVRKVRCALGVPTLLNVMGPSLNPGRAECRLIGVFDPNLVDVIVKLLQLQQCRSAFVFHGAGGLDELSPIGESHGLHLRADGSIAAMTVAPELLGLPKCSVEDLRGSTATANAERLCEIFAEGIDTGPIVDTLCLNAGVGLWLMQLEPSVKAGIQRARNAIASKQAFAKLLDWRNFCTMKQRQT